MISGLSYNIMRNYEVVMIENALLGQWVLILMRVCKCDCENTIDVFLRNIFSKKAIEFF